MTEIIRPDICGECRYHCIRDPEILKEMEPGTPNQICCVDPDIRIRGRALPACHRGVKKGD